MYSSSVIRHYNKTFNKNHESETEPSQIPRVRVWVQVSRARVRVWVLKKWPRVLTWTRVFPTLSITTSYQKIKDDSILDDINKEAKKIAQNLKFADRIECFSHREAFTTLKDHKENFHNKPSYRLINPAKSELGEIATFYIDKINKIIRAKTNNAVGRALITEVN